MSEPPFEDLKAHTAVVVGALPETGEVVGGVRSVVGVDAPVPFAVGADQVVADERPFIVSGFQPCSFPGFLVLVQAADNGLCLDPPVTVGIPTAGRGIIFIDHSAFAGKAFHRGGGDFGAD